MAGKKNLYRIDELFSQEELMVRDAVRDFVDKSVLPIIAEHYRQGTFPRQLVAQMAELGLLGSTLQGYGCAGIGPVAYGLAMQELERGDSGIRSFASVQSGLVMYPIYTYGSEAQKEAWLPKLAKGEAIGCYGLTEADFGSNPGGMRTTAKKKGNEYILNGSKMWITNGDIADVAVVFAKLGSEVCGFLVERGRPGYSTREIQGKLSLRASVTSELWFEDCKIPLDNMLPKARGLKTALACLSQARYGIAWGVLGAAQACYEEALGYAQNRIMFDKPIAHFQLIQSKLVEMWNEIVKGQLLAWRLGRLKEEGKEHHAEISAAKRNNVKIALDIARDARDILGASGIVDEYGSMRHSCNLESVHTYEGTYNMHTLIVGKELTGLDAIA